MDLISLYNRQKELTKRQEELDLENELTNIICAIAKGEDEIKLESDDLIKDIGFKVKPKKECVQEYIGYGDYCHYNRNVYYIKLNERNIKKINKYLEEVNHERN